MKHFVFLLVIAFISCETTEIDPVDINWTKKNSSELNKNLAIQEEINIKLFLEMRKDWILTKTGSGLQYYIYEHGDKEAAIHPGSGDIAEIEYEVKLLDGTVVSKTESDEYEEFKVDNSNIESGVQEAVKLLTVGDHAKLIIPSHIGHGLIGDMDKIPPLTTLVIDIYLLGLK